MLTFSEGQALSTKTIIKAFSRVCSPDQSVMSIHLDANFSPPANCTAAQERPLSVQAYRLDHPLPLARQVCCQLLVHWEHVFLSKYMEH